MTKESLKHALELDSDIVQAKEKLKIINTLIEEDGRGSLCLSSAHDVCLPLRLFSAEAKDFLQEVKTRLEQELSHYQEEFDKL